MLKKVDKNNFPRHLVELVASHKSVSQTICDFGEEDISDNYAEDWEKIYNAFNEREKNIVAELLSMPDYEEVSDEIYNQAEIMVVKLRKTGFSKKQIQEYIKNLFKVRITPEDIIWFHNICKDVSNLNFIDLNNYRDIELLTEEELKKAQKIVGTPRGNK